MEKNDIFRLTGFSLQHSFKGDSLHTVRVIDNKDSNEKFLKKSNSKDITSNTKKMQFVIYCILIMYPAKKCTYSQRNYAIGYIEAFITK